MCVHADRIKQLPHASKDCWVYSLHLPVVVFSLLFFVYSSPIDEHAKDSKNHEAEPLGPRSPRVALLNSPPESSTSEAPTTELLNPAGTLSLSSLSLDQFLAAIRSEVCKELDSRTPQPSLQEQGVAVPPDDESIISRNSLDFFNYTPCSLN